MKFEINRGNELIRRGESIVYNWIFSIEGPRNLYRGGGARVSGIPNRPYFSIPLWKSENTPIPQRKSCNEPRRHRVIGASILDVTLKEPSRRLKEEAARPRGIFAYRRKKIKPKASWRQGRRRIPRFYGGKIIPFVISIWKRRSTSKWYGVVSKNLRRGDRYLSVDARIRTYVSFVVVKISCLY